MKKTIEDELREHPFFAPLQTYVAMIAGCGKNVVYKAGEYLFREDESADTFFVIRKGLVAIELFVPPSGSVCLQTEGSGEVIGWSWIFPPYRYSMDAKAIEDTRVIAVDGKCLRSKCEQDPKLGYDVMKRFAEIISERLHSTHLRVLDMYGSVVGGSH